MHKQPDTQTPTTAETLLPFIGGQCTFEVVMDLMCTTTLIHCGEISDVIDLGEGTIILMLRWCCRNEGERPHADWRESNLRIFSFLLHRYKPGRTDGECFVMEHCKIQDRAIRFAPPKT